MDLKSLLGEASKALKDEEEAVRTPEEKTLHSVAQRLLLLERELKATGSGRGDEARIESLLDAIAKERF
jgi:hypothetical protein